MVRVKADAARTAGRFPRINRRNRAKSSVPLGYDEPTDDAGDSISLSFSLATWKADGGITVAAYCR